MKQLATKGIFTLSGLEGRYEGYSFHDVSDYWNGYAMPWFSLDVAFDIFIAHNERDSHSLMRYDEDGDYFLEGNRAYPTEGITTQDGVLHLYGIGNQSWRWEEVKQR